MPEPGEPQRSAARAPTRSPGLLLIVGALVVVGAVLLGYVVWQNQSEPAESRTEVANFSGDGDQITESFTVEEGWQVHWENEGETFAFAIRGDFDFGTVIDQEAPGSGITSPVPTGTFHFEVTAEGPWRIQVLQGD